MLITVTYLHSNDHAVYISTFFWSENLFSAPSRNLPRNAHGPATARDKDQRCSRGWTEEDCVHSLLCTKGFIMYVLYTFLALQTSGVHPILMASTHFFFRTTPLQKMWVT